MPQQLAPSQTYVGGQTYAVGFYNEFAGYTIGQVWKDPFKPDLSVTTSPSEGFPEGTVLFKLLFVDVPTCQVPSLTNAVSWNVYITDTFASANRSMRTVSLIQMDLMVKDRRAAPVGWVFGTFQYNGALGPASYTNLVPVGLMWGEDEDLTTDYYTPFPVKTYINPLLHETIINPDETELPPTHLGWNGRLNGPVDNPRSSCMSCHMTAEFPQLTPMSPLFISPPGKIPAGGSPEWMQWFKNRRCGEPVDADAMSTDASLQLSESVANFYTWLDDQGGVYAANNGRLPPKAPRVLRNGLPAQVHPVLRGREP
jgi:hypothetical protein